MLMMVADRIGLRVGTYVVCNDFSRPGGHGQGCGDAGRAEQWPFRAVSAAARPNCGRRRAAEAACSRRREQPCQRGWELLVPPAGVMPAGPFVMAAGQPGPLQAPGPLTGRLAEPGSQCSGGQVVAGGGRAGLTAERARDHPGAERRHRGEHVAAALPGGDRPGTPAGETSGDPGSFGPAGLAGHPRDDLAGDEPKVRVEPAAVDAGEIFLGAPIRPPTGRPGSLFWYGTAPWSWPS